MATETYPGDAMPARYRLRPGRRKPHFVIVRRDGRESAKAFATEEEALALIALHEQEDAARSAWLSTHTLPVDGTCRGWLATYGPTMAASTRETAGGLIDTHLAPYFGSTDLRTLSEEHLIAFADHVIQTARSAKRPRKGTAVAANALSVLRTVCSHHVAAGLLPKNPAAGARELASRVAANYEPEVREVDSWTVAECETLLALALEHEPHVHVPLLFMLHTGVRRGEALGLRWEKVDLGRKRVAIVRSRVRGEDRQPKSGKARHVPLSPALAAVLGGMARGRQSREGLHSDPGYVFQAPRGGQWDEHNFSRAWRRLRTRAAKDGVRPLKLHCTRHTFATLALEGGRSVRWVARVLGHADPALTLRTYAHVLEHEDDDLAFLPGTGLSAVRETA